jgi:hypothetical protein
MGSGSTTVLVGGDGTTLLAGWHECLSVIASNNATTGDSN